MVALRLNQSTGSSLTLAVCLMAVAGASDSARDVEPTCNGWGPGHATLGSTRTTLVGAYLHVHMHVFV
jgi:hypothetical protein